MRKSWRSRSSLAVLVGSLALVVAAAAVAVAQTSGGNTYNVVGKIASGGTKKKPRHVAIVFNYTVKGANGALSQPVKTYKLHFEGLRFDVKHVAGGTYCSAATINATASDAQCPKGTHIGDGQVKSFIGVAGQPIAPDQKCDLALDIYAGGPSSLALFLHGQQPQCIAPISQAINAKLAVDKTGGSLTYTVPQQLLHPVQGLDAGITSVASTIVKGTGDHGPFTSMGCSGTRSIDATFSEEGGATRRATTGAGRC